LLAYGPEDLKAED
jgi:hypothetical protein